MKTTDRVWHGETSTRTNASRSATSLSGRDKADDAKSTALLLGNAEHAYYHGQVKRHMDRGAGLRLAYTAVIYAVASVPVVFILYAIMTSL